MEHSGKITWLWITNFRLIFIGKFFKKYKIFGSFKKKKVYEDLNISKKKKV